MEKPFELIMQPLAPSIIIALLFPFFEHSAKNRDFTSVEIWSKICNQKIMSLQLAISDDTILGFNFSVMHMVKHLASGAVILQDFFSSHKISTI